LSEIEPPGLDILYALSIDPIETAGYHIRNEDEEHGFCLVGVDGAKTPASEYLHYHFQFSKSSTIEWLARLVELRLVTCNVKLEYINTIRTTWEAINLTMLGKTLIEWTIDADLNNSGD
jgi:hypothetical protein